MRTWQERETRVYMTTGRRQPVTLIKGQGLRVWDDAGKAYLDFVGGWAVNTLGHCHPAMVKAIEEQARTLFLASNQFYTTPQIELAELLVANSCLQRVFIANSGAEANEGAVKLARKWGKLHRNNAYEVITTDHSFHGRTLSMVAATGKPEGRVIYEPVPQGFVTVPYDNIEALRGATNEKTVAIMLEPVQGEGGVNVPSDDYLKQVRAWCDEAGLLLILDEVQTGVGRTGTLWGYQSAGIEPDIMTLAKGLGGGVPISALLAKQDVAVFTPGDHGSTYGGNPLVCAGALAAFTYIVEHDMPGHARDVGEYFQAKLRGLQQKHGGLIREIRGRGLLVGMELTQNVAMPIVTEALHRGMLLNAVNDNTIRFMPPLIITEQDVDEAIGILDGVLADVPAIVHA